LPDNAPIMSLVRPFAALTAARAPGSLVVLALMTALVVGACNTNRVDPLASQPDLSPAPEVTPCNHCATDLEALLPTQIGATKLSAVSLNGPGFMATGNIANRTALTQMLTSLGKTPADLSVAQAEDPSGVLVFKEGIFRVTGSAPGALLAAWLAAQQAVQPSLVAGQITLDGQVVTKLADSKNLEAPPSYIVAKGDELWIVAARDQKLIDEAISRIH
jgi:hypothetical protein